MKYGNDFLVMEESSHLFFNIKTCTVSSKQRLSSEEGGLQHVCCLYNQHVLQPPQILKLQTFERLKHKK